MTTPAGRKLIFITNDDGFEAQGIHVLTELMRTLGDVVVVAPDGPRSGAACSITPTVPVSLTLRQSEPSLTVFSCSGTPVDCVKLASEQCLPRVPDLMVSGINHGDNASVSLHYSGTMGAVIESCAKGIPSIGYSLRTLKRHCDFAPYAATILAIARRTLQEGLPEGTCLNVNFPEVAELKGVRACRQGRGLWTGEWVDAHNPHARRTFWLTGRFQNLEPEATDTDYWALDHGYASLTPVSLDMTDYRTLKNYEW